MDRVEKLDMVYKTTLAAEQSRGQNAYDAHIDAIAMVRLTILQGIQNELDAPVHESIPDACVPAVLLDRVRNALRDLP